MPDQTPTPIPTSGTSSSIASSLYGFVFVPEAEQGPMSNAKQGATIHKADRRPPWIVVDHSLQSILAANWPGTLWKVEVIEAAPEQVSPRFTRAAAVRVVEEHPVAQLFGPRGDAVLNVIEKARTLEMKDIHILAQAIDARASEAYGRSWSTWLATGELVSTHPSQDYSDTLTDFSKGAHSPIGQGFSILYEVFSRRARSLAGDAPFVIDDEGDLALTPDWANALHALLCAAMAFGAPELMSSTERDLLISASIHAFA